MFKANNSHHQSTLFNTKDMLNDRTKKMLEKSWAPIFYQEVFCNIDETPFAVLCLFENSETVTVKAQAQAAFFRFTPRNQDKIP